MKQVRKTLEVCPECKGEKKVDHREKLCNGDYVEVKTLCPLCMGSGRVQITVLSAKKGLK